MLTARSTSPWRGTYAISADGRPVTTWTPKVWTAGGEFDLGGRRYAFAGRGFGSRYALTADGVPVAQADRVGRKDWTLTEGGRTHTFRRASVWRSEQLLVDGDRVLGGVRRTGRWRTDAEADLPGLDLPVQVFALTVVLTLWTSQATAAAVT
jgi:hypothetical protein